MVHIRGNDRDFNEWEAAGNEGWGWDNVLEYFKKSEGMRVKEIIESDKDGKYHNTDGPLKVDSFHNREPIRDVVMKGGEELGYSTLVDINADKYIGLTITTGTLDGNRRCTTAKAFLNPVKDRPNLFVIKHAHVTKVNIDEKKRATGVEFIVDNKKLNAKAKKEVILSAGTVNTPQLLMLSGIGPRKHLKELGIKVVADLPVGKNLQGETKLSMQSIATIIFAKIDYNFLTYFFHLDHAYIPLPLKFDYNDPEPPKENAFLDTLYKYVHNEYGQAGNGVFDLLGFFDTVDRNGKYPDIQTHYNLFRRGEDILLPRYLNELMGYNERLSNSIIKESEHHDILFYLSILARPKSKGEIRLRSNNPFDHPIIDANYFANEDDVKALVRGVRLTQKFMKTKAYREHNFEEIKLDIPECDAIGDHNSDEYYECIVRHLVSTLFHPVGTAKMGPVKDPTTVVDSRLRVKGVKGLRVIDASIMPNITSCNVNAPTIMIGNYRLLNFSVVDHT